MFIVGGISRFRTGSNPDLEATWFNPPISVSAEKSENFVGQFKAD